MPKSALRLGNLLYALSASLFALRALLFAGRQLQLHLHLILKRRVAAIAQLVRAPDCGSGGRGFEPH